LENSAAYLSYIVPVFAFLTTFLFQKYFLSRGIIDNINNRSSHKVIATRSGGISIFFPVGVISIIFYIIGVELFDYSILVSLFLLFMIGLYDDLYNVDFKLKFIFQIIAAKILIDNGYIIDNFHGVFGFYEIGRIYAQIFTIFIIVSIINSINFIDGIDGLALTYTLKFIILFEFFQSSESIFKILSLIVGLSILPLLYFNFKKTKKVFLGDSGSLFLGGLVSVYVINILNNNYLIKADYDIHKIIFVISILSYPIFDIIRVTLLRIIKGHSPFKADNNHIHHRILKLTNSHKKTTALICILSIVLLIFIQLFF
jgi:UDP-N-acetylmuramyl pentapeptide phosphotransferase/UDP-N-acetylglucosamine-1-phosphate transferase